MMETAVKTWEAETNNGEITITPIIEFLNNIKFLASAYNQMWVIKKMKYDGEDTIAFVDDVTGLQDFIIRGNAMANHVVGGNTTGFRKSVIADICRNTAVIPHEFFQQIV